MNLKSISLYVFSYKKSYYLTHPFCFIKEIWTGVKNAWHRMRYGFAWVDLWNMDVYFGELVSSMLRELADRACGCPESEECSDMETYREYLREFANLWDYAHLEEEFVPAQIESLHSNNAQVEGLFARARIALMDAPDWKEALTRFVYTELGALAARGWLWD